MPSTPLSQFMNMPRSPNKQKRQAPRFSLSKGMFPHEAINAAIIPLCCHTTFSFFHYTPRTSTHHPRTLVVYDVSLHLPYLQVKYHTTFVLITPLCLHKLLVTIFLDPLRFISAYYVCFSPPSALIQRLPSVVLPKNGSVFR
jgi:hypothetical protein